MIGRFMKTYLHKPIKILQFLTPGRIQKCLRACFFELANKTFKKLRKIN